MLTTYEGSIISLWLLLIVVTLLKIVSFLIN